MQFLLATTVQRYAFASRCVESITSNVANANICVVVVDDRFGEVVKVASRNGGPDLDPLSESKGGAKVRWTTLQSFAQSFPLAQIVQERGYIAPTQGLSGDEARLYCAQLALSYKPEFRVSAVLPFLVDAYFGALKSVDPQGALIVVSDDYQALPQLRELTLKPDSYGCLFSTRNSMVPSDGKLPDRVGLETAGPFDSSIFVVKERAMANAIYRGGIYGLFDSFVRCDKSRSNPLSGLAFEQTVLSGIEVRSNITSFFNVDEQKESWPLSSVGINFSGFDPAKAWMLSTQAGESPRVLLTNYPVLANACRFRSDYVLAKEVIADPFATLPNGHVVDEAMRFLYRLGLEKSIKGPHPIPPNPFVAGQEEDFVGFLATDVGYNHGFDAPLSAHFVQTLTMRNDLTELYQKDSKALTSWAVTESERGKFWTPQVFIEALDVATGESKTSGINVIGHMGPRFGLSAFCELVVKAVDESRIPYSTSPVGQTRERSSHNVELCVFNADQMAQVLQRYDRTSDSFCVGLWSWETTELPKRMHSAYNLVDEIWSHSDFMVESLSKSAQEYGVQVRKYPLRLPQRDLSKFDPAKNRQIVEAMLGPLGISYSAPMFYFSFDYFSVMDRKSPIELVQAFQLAFGRSPSNAPDRPILVIKSINGDHFPAEREQLLHAISADSNVKLLESRISEVERDALITHSRAFVSLHKSEGFGLAIAEAMALGTPVVATNWSGNLEFMTQDNSYLIDFDLVDIEANVAVYGGAGQWAKPHIDHAASALVELLDRPRVGSLKAKLALENISERNAQSLDVAFIYDRLRSPERIQKGIIQ